MRTLPLPTEVFASIDDFVPLSGSAYIYGLTHEDRTAHSPEWERRATGVQFVKAATQTRDEAAFEAGSYEKTVSLRSQTHLADLVETLPQRPTHVYLDMTGLDHHVWAPLLRAVESRFPTSMVYVEPLDYRFSPAPTESEIFDLSERIQGIAPLPGFASLSEPTEDEVCFVPLLGFEGTRLAHVLETMQPPGDRIYPIVGVPGFRPEYPFHAYQGNRPALTESGAWRDVRFAVANCPFDLYDTLVEIENEHPNHVLQIAPIGTKPHGLGAVLFALRHQTAELVYDHPVRKAKRTAGSARLLVYHLNLFAR